MTGRTHDLISFASLLTVVSLHPPSNLNLITAIASMMGGVVGALVPDMDQATNHLWDLLPAGNFVGKIFRNLMLQHRTISHSILGGFIFYNMLLYIIPKILNPEYVNISLVIASLMIGYISHLFADCFTKEGLPLFFPFQFKIGIPPIKSFRITTGKFVETFIFFPGTLIYIFYLIFTKNEVFLYLIQLIKS
jgi:inner membrane protein